MPDNRQTEKLCGTVEDIIYHSEDSGFTVMTVGVGDELITVVGETSAIGEGEEVEVTGYYTSHATYGTQFKAQIIQRTLPNTANAILKYLSAGAIKGVGPSYAKKLVMAFGDETLNILEQHPEKIATIQGISKKKALAICEEFRRLYGIRSLMIFLANYGLTATQSIVIWKKYGGESIDIIKQNPYILCDDGVGLEFSAADKFAVDFGIEPHSYCRIEAGILHILRHNSRNGHVCLPTTKLTTMAQEFLDIGTDMIDETLDTMCNDAVISLYKCSDNEYAYITELFMAENYIAGRAKLMLQLHPETHYNIDSDIDLLEQELAISYDDLQRKAISSAVNSSMFILTGGPGTGKTTTVNGILALLEKQGKKVLLAAPTGRAAKRMSEVTSREAKTIHRLLEVEPGAEKLSFKRNEKNPLPADVIIIDEMSMVDTLLMDNLMRGIKITSQLILVGDCDQLPSVSAGNVLRDFIDSGIVPTVHLDKVFRQATSSLIVTNAHAIVAGEYPKLTARNNDFFFLNCPNQDELRKLTVDLCVRRLPKTYSLSPLWDIQIIVPGKQGPVGTIELNKALQAELNPSDGLKTEVSFFGRTFREGDKIMQLRNNYDIVCKTDDDIEVMGIFNGDIGIIEMIDLGSKSILIRFDDKVANYTFEEAEQIELAYAITVHKSQGSEFEVVVMPLGNKHSLLHYRNLLYTGVTRARKLLVMAGNPATIANMVDNNRRTLRYTGLMSMLQTETPPIF